MATEQPTPEQIQKQFAIDHREAMQILRGEAQFFPEKRHLFALARAAGAQEAHVAHLGSILAAIVHDSGQASLTIDGGLMKHVRETPILVAVHTQPNGDLVVEKVMPTVKPSASVN